MKRFDPQEAFSQLAAGYAGKEGVVFGEGKGFGSNALKVNGKIFAFVSSDEKLVVKLPRDRVRQLVESGRGDHFEAGKGRPMKEWFVAGGEEGWEALVDEAYKFVRG